MTSPTPFSAPAGTRIGHVHLRVSDLERSIAFYRDVIGLKLMQRYGTQAAFLAADDYHHHIGLNTWESRGGAPAPKGHPGLFHTAFLYPDRKSLGAAIAQVAKCGVGLTGAADHGVSEAVYLDDPDGNGIELYTDRAMDEWPRGADGELEIVNAPLDVDALVALATT
ncbi:VOC family protein [Ahrensia sp. R2A130]|uniref:VOC family protein n=1 Tax=Ahrensia sp. R2A130 TaxID=744979 RepID=UPI0001E0D09C|nr:VOC family protein [Ahrensia sp. R2A130]EFL90283.1 biphenyl-2,3-diol 1,2-dioxygenase III [Ahrensia sp. R2A130]